MGASGVDEDLDLRDFSGICRLFPLPGVVLFPHAIQPLHIFEPRYRQMTEDALASDRLIALVQVQPDADWTGDDEPAIEPIACLGRIIKHERLPDGRFNILLQGRARIRIVRELVVPTLYRQAEAEILAEVDPPQPVDPSEKADLIAVYREVARRADGLDPEFDAMLGSGPPLGIVTDLIAQSLGLPAALKQALLADRRADRRGKALLSILRQVAGRLDPDQTASRPFPPPFSVN
jgi:uncharacterized protein